MSSQVSVCEPRQVPLGPPVLLDRLGCLAHRVGQSAQCAQDGVALELELLLVASLVQRRHTIHRGLRRAGIRVSCFYLRGRAVEARLLRPPLRVQAGGQRRTKSGVPPHVARNLAFAVAALLGRLELDECVLLVVELLQPADATHAERGEAKLDLLRREPLVETVHADPRVRVVRRAAGPAEVVPVGCRRAFVNCIQTPLACFLRLRFSIALAIW
mmetsp:Transcript_43371/g.76442  ORF Transcript_43371/g.76442 Transcript_43371/m.76442 type:complete len:215 (+) Transcript_43371:258-902(+)